MKLKINRASDLSSISVLPPHSRRSSSVPRGAEPSSLSGKSQQASQIRMQQQQQSQQSFSQGISSQHGIFSQFSQNSQDEALTNELRLVSQERENSLKKTSSLPPINYTRDDSQMQISRSSNSFMRKWSAPEYKCQIGEELEHRIGMMETSLSRLAMILDSVQSDIMQVNKGTKDLALETESIRQKLIVLEDSLQLMNKGNEEIKAGLDEGFNSMSGQFKQNTYQDKLSEVFPLLSALSGKMETQLAQLQNELCKTFTKEMQAMACSVQIADRKQETSSDHPPKGVRSCAPTQEMLFLKRAATYPEAHQATLVPNFERGGWKSVKHKDVTSKEGNMNERRQIKVSPGHLDKEQRIVIDSDEELDGGFSCLLEEKTMDVGKYSIDDTLEVTERLLRKARRRKRKHCNTIIIN